MQREGLLTNGLHNTISSPPPRAAQRVSVLYQIEPSIPTRVQREGLLTNGLHTTISSPPPRATVLPTHGLPQQGLLCTVGVDLDPQEGSTRKGDVWSREPSFNETTYDHGRTKSPSFAPEDGAAHSLFTT